MPLRRCGINVVRPSRQSDTHIERERETDRLTSGYTTYAIFKVSKYILLYGFQEHSKNTAWEVTERVEIRYNEILHNL